MTKVVCEFSILSVVSGQKLDIVRIYQNYWEKLKKNCKYLLNASF